MNEIAPRTVDPASAPVHVLAREIAARRLSPVDIVDALLARIERLEPKLHAFTEVYAADARLAAEGADKAIRSGHAVGRLHGIPVALKDLIELEGRITTGGSAAWRERRSTLTATIARRMIAQGMIVLGKTHTVEFAFGGWGHNPHMGTPWNPWDLATHRTPGGSSNGSGVAVAARMAPWAIGTDTGGSVRLPSSFCGLTGLKLTVGRASTYGILPLSETLDTPGPMTRSVEDAALLFEVLQGPDPLDPATRGIPLSDPIATLKRGVRGLRLARMPDQERDGVSAEMLAAYDQSLAVLADLGAEIIDLRLPVRFEELLQVHEIIRSEAYFYNRALVDDPQAPLGDAVRGRLLDGRTITAHDYLKARRTQRDLKAAMYEALEGVDALLTPTTKSAALPLEDAPEAVMPSHFTRFGNILELCALALPNGFTPGGLPLSLQIVCRGYEEAMALRIGYAYQQATDWHLREPNLAL